MPLPVVLFESLLDRSLSDVSAFIESAPRACVGNLTLGDWTADPDIVNGVYIFYLEQGDLTPFYVGKCSSRSFLSRIPSHFETREDDWMNGLCKYVKKYRGLESYHEAVRQALNCQLVLIAFPYPLIAEELEQRKNNINRLEAILQRYMQPIMNKKENSFSGCEILRNLLPNAQPCMTQSVAA